MSIPVLVQVYDEVRRLAIAGSSVACGDFRLKKLIAPLQKSGEKAPVFAKVAEAVSNVVDSTEKTSAAALLTLSTLVNAILYTQGETGAAGKLEPIEMVGDGITPKRTPASLLKAVANAMTSTGSGRLEVIDEALAHNPFPDPRLLGPAIAGLDGSYHEVCDLVESKVLPLYGRSIVPMVLEKFDIKGGAGDARRLSLLHRVDPKGCDKYIRHALKKGSSEVRIAAIAKLRNTQDVPFLLEQSVAKAAPVRAAVFLALAEIDNKDAATAIAVGLTKGRNAPEISAARVSRHPIVLVALLQEIRESVSRLLATKAKDPSNSSQAGRIEVLLQALEQRTDKQTEALLLELYPQRDAIEKAEGKLSQHNNAPKILRLMAQCSDKTRDLLISNHKSYDDVGLGVAAVAGVKHRDPAEVYDLFHGYLDSASAAKGKKSLAKAKSQVVVNAITNFGCTIYADISMLERQEKLREKLDPRWLDLAVKLSDVPVVIQLARAGHAAAHKVLATELQKQLDAKKINYELFDVLNAIAYSQHPKADDYVIEVIRKGSKLGYGYYSFNICRLITLYLPKSAVPKLEALMAELPENESDRYIVAVADLKNRV